MPLNLVADKACALLLATAAIAVITLNAASPAGAETTSCATGADGQPPDVRALPSGCGIVSFPVDAGLRQRGELQLAVGGSSVYARSIKLTYGNPAIDASAGVQEITLHRLLEAGDASPSFPTARDGRPLMLVTLDVSPPAYGADPPLVMLGAANGAGQAETGTPTPGATRTAKAALDMTQWVEIGSAFAQIDKLQDHISIGQQKGKFDRLVLSSHGGDVPVQRVQVVPVNAPPFAVDVRAVIAPGMLSGTIAIEPPDLLREVVVTYGTAAPGRRAAAIEVYGRYDENWLGRTGENLQFAGGWVMLGTADVIASRTSGAARGGLRVGGQENARFKRLRFVARRGAISLMSVMVDSGGGQQETLAVEALLQQDIASKPVEFKSGPLAIESLTLTPRVRPHGMMDATVEVWAQY